MPPALSTTKRKFHRLLDSISNASSPSLATHQPNSTTASSTTLSNPHQDSPTTSKRPRIEKARPLSAHVPRSAGTGLASVSSPSQRPKSIAAAQTNMTLSLSGEHKRPPNYAPWDRGVFLERLKTFRFVDKWRAKPDGRIGEVEWARRGWSCVGRERVACVGGCSEEIVIKLEEDALDGENIEEGDGLEKRRKVGGEGDGEDAERGEEEGDDWREKAQEQLVERYAEMISTGHAEGCLWRRRGCDDTIQRLPLVHQNIALDGLRARYASLLAMAQELPSEISTPKSLDTEKTVHQAASLLLNPSETPAEISSTEEINKSALLLALFGWQAEDNHISGLATCNACFRRLGLWLFKSSDSSMDRLDVMGEHRDHCPWINPLSQNGGTRRSSLEGLAGWEVLLRVVNAKAVRRKPLSEVANGPVRRDSLEDEVGDAASLTETVAEEGEKTRDERDRERWAKLKRLKRVFHVKNRPGTSGSATGTTVENSEGAT